MPGMQVMTRLAGVETKVRIRAPEDYSGATAALPVLELAERVDGELGEEFCA